jgi:hypothetical protein
MDVQHRGAGVVAIDRLLHLLVNADRDVLGKVRGEPFGTVRRCGNYQFLLVLRNERAIEEVHDQILSSDTVEKGGNHGRRR